MTDDRSSAPTARDRAGVEYALGGDRWRGDDGSPLAPTPVPGMTPERIRARERSIWRYAEALPVDARVAVSLGEGVTPLVPLERAGASVMAKLEWFNPTASFKDRGAAVLVSHLRAQGATHILEDSSGNGGSAMAAYAAAAGIRATIVMPERTSPEKVAQASAFGAEIRLVPGTRDEVAAEAVRLSTEIPYASHNWHPMFLHGVKTIGYELWEALGHLAPDNVVTVAGAGSVVLGVDLAFRELIAAGQLAKGPRLLIGQPEHWAPIADAVTGTDPSSRGPRVPTVAEGASIASPVRGPEVIDAIRRSGGGAVAVSEREIVDALRSLLARGLYAEPTSAVAVAALDRFLAAGVIRPEEITVVVLTGSGLKAGARTAELMREH